MSCGNGGCYGKLCPVSLGLALGLVGGLAVILMVIYAAYYGVPARWEGADLGVAFALTKAFWAFLKGFIFGFFLALFYDLILCCCKKICCRKDAACCAGDKKSDVK